MFTKEKYYKSQKAAELFRKKHFKIKLINQEGVMIA